MKLSEQFKQYKLCDCNEINYDYLVSQTEQLEADAELGRLVRMMPHDIALAAYGNDFCIARRMGGGHYKRDILFGGLTPEEALQKFYKEKENG